MVLSDAADQPGLLQLIAEVRQNALEHRDRLTEGDRLLGLRGALQADGDRVLESTRAEEVMSEVNGPCALGGREHVGSARVNLLSSRGDDLGVDRLRGEGMATPVAARAIRALLDQLPGDRRLRSE